ncbi:cache domain-containing protein [Parendozoicomonas sp. Alg238-R29]|uniref:cache domain-containing protein n=1 Tax=Parendozoicomonas sp. Alg238-R29 TaxID=2993446 RepID=UPI00248DEB57|nr:cache domain-containing protein [Parendozoicomonas sp. Alg238-R29]
MTLKIKILLLALLPLIIMSVAITTLNQRQARDLSEQEIATFERNLLASKREQLQHYVDLALASIHHTLSLLEHGASREYVESEVKRQLNELAYGDDGYFFAYTLDGVNLVHPVQPELVGENLMDIQDGDGKYLIQELLWQATHGGGFERYMWRKPSEDGQEDKLSYVVVIPELNWMMGTGLYVDDIVEEVAAIRRDVNKNIQDTFFTVLVIISGTVVLIVLLGVAINIHESQLADKRLQELAHRSLKLQVSQRRNFARELHDGINQLLVSAKLRVNLVDKKWEQKVAREHLKKASCMLDMAMQEVRRVSHDLRPIVLDDLGLEAALRNMLDDLAERTDLQVHSSIHLPEQRLPDVIEITLYRVVQEALTNIEKHAGASEVKLTVQFKDDVVYLKLEDDGCGFYEHDQSGIGLINMRERTELLGGKFTINSYPQPSSALDTNLTTGTIIKATFYLAAVYETNERELIHES